VAQREINLCSCALGGGVGKALSCAGRRGWCFAHWKAWAERSVTGMLE